MFWIVIPGYNTANYVRETIESVIHQTIGFEEHISLFLVDDCSTDDTLKIFREYKQKYPNNVVVKHFENNRGVSAARNYAVEQCKKKENAIVGFLDSDDLLQEDVIEKVDRFFAEQPDVNIASVEVRYFGAKEGEHRLNWKFHERKVVDIKKDYQFPQYYIGGVFLKNSALQALQFNEQMNFWEDALAINKCILNEGKYGLVKDAFYLYRKREDESSLVDRAWHDKERYTSFLDNGYLEIIAYSKKKYWRVIPYVQFLVAYHLRLFMWKSKGDVISELLSEEEMQKFRKKLQSVLKYIRSSIIAEIPSSVPVLEMMMSIKKGKKVRARREYTENDCIFSFRGRELARMSERKVRIYPTRSTLEGFEGMWHGIFATPIFQMSEDDGIFMEKDGVRLETIHYPSGRKLNLLGERIRNYRCAAFAFEVPEDWDKFRFGIHTRGIDIMLNEVTFENGIWNWEGTDNSLDKVIED